MHIKLFLYLKGIYAYWFAVIAYRECNEDVDIAALIVILIVNVIGYSGETLGLSITMRNTLKYVKTISMIKTNLTGSVTIVSSIW